MKYLVSLLVFAIILSSCESSSENTMILTGNIEGLKKGTVLLQKIEDTLLLSIDSVTINGDPTFTFKDEITSPEVYYLYLRLKDGSLLDERIPFFAEPSEINITTSLKSFAIDAEITGSLNQDKSKEYNKLMQRYRDRNLELIENEFIARKDGKDSAANALRKQQNALQRSSYLATINFARNNPDIELSPYLLINETPDINIKYLDTIYNSLAPKIKDSKYGKDLESLIKNRKSLED
ncbi:DUF4369 domain-containing protein [Patiriisocius hiemis]|uniref:DUF4369 domain-containing protein n=1 Tax=Patiriisocius hiemis TaxID=3075604 RepID=A0ABU2Y854_9FLAO|nr:DUF4369 domain-containing protein [Constantimarinum sp. W242]MDT0554375.1 DUF4369 domain-containing protein [Constantimarinum sp. W242]